MIYKMAQQSQCLRDSMQIANHDIPTDFTQRCINGEKGGVLLVYINGKDSAEIEKKKNDIINYVENTIRATYPRPQLKQDATLEP